MTMRVEHFVSRETLAVETLAAEARAAKNGTRIYARTKGTVCSKCHAAPPRPGQRYCAKCHAAAQTRYRAKLLRDAGRIRCN